MAKFILMAVGCIECDEPTFVVGVFHSVEEAKAALQLIRRPAFAEELEQVKHGCFEIFELPEPGTIRFSRSL